MFDDIFLVFNEYAYQFERDLRITSSRKTRLLLHRMPGLHTRVFLKSLKI